MFLYVIEMAYKRFKLQISFLFTCTYHCNFLPFMSKSAHIHKRKVGRTHRFQQAWPNTYLYEGVPTGGVGGRGGGKKDQAH